MFPDAGLPLMPFRLMSRPRTPRSKPCRARSSRLSASLECLYRRGSQVGYACHCHHLSNSLIGSFSYGSVPPPAPTDYVPRADYDDQALEVHGLREQLVGVLEELAARERELAEEQDVHHRYLAKMQTYADQVSMEAALDRVLPGIMHRNGKSSESFLKNA